MKQLPLSSTVLCVLLLAAPASAQMLPVTTTSEEAREQFELGRHAAFHYQDAQAFKHLDAAIAADSTFVLAYLHRGGMSQRFERKPYLDLAARHRHRVSEDEQRMVDAFFAFLWDGEVNVAVTIFEGLAAKYPDDPYLPTYLGLRYLRNLHRYNDAKAQFERALARDSSFAQAQHWIGYTAMEQGDYAEAEAAFRKYAGLVPYQPRPYDSLGELYRRMGRYDDAAAHFERAIERDPWFAESREKLARIQIERTNERFEDAFGRQDATGLAALYVSTGQLMPAGSGVVQGREAITAYWKNVFDAGITGADLETLEVYLGANRSLATEVGRYRLTAGGDEADTGKYVVIWYHAPESWQLYRDIWTSDGTPGP